MRTKECRSMLPGMALVAALPALLTACAMGPKQEAPAVPDAAQSVAASPPPVMTAESRAMAQKRAIEARDLLQEGDENAASSVLAQALSLDPSNELARKLMDQVKADPQAVLGAAHFDYTIQPGDSLSRLAERFLGDRMRFYILARYNGIANPSRVAVGQTVKIPGDAPRQPAPPPRPAEAVRPAPARAAPRPETQAPKPAPARPAPRPEAEAPPPKPQAPAKTEATAPPGPPKQAQPAAATPAPAPTPSPAAEQARRKALAQRYYQEGLAAFHKQDLDTAIRKWDQVLELDPDNDSARLNRARALDLKARLERFPKR